VKLPAFITKYKQRRARRKYERDKELRAQEGEEAVNRVAENAANYLGGGGSSGG
jgi:hypothetical protein